MRTAPGRRRLLAGLVVGCHPGPTATVTFVVTALAAAAGQPRSQVGWVAAAVLTGQLAVGWCNDARDADRDRLAGRVEKPTVRGWIDARTLAVAAVVAAVVTLPLSYLAAGPVGGTAHVVAVAAALAYDLWLKPTVLSFVPWLLAFSLVPVFVTYGLQPPTAPAPWSVVVCGLLGVGAHLANAARDVDSDRVVGAGGLASALGAARSRAGAVVALLLATTILVRQLHLPTVVSVGLVLVLLAAVVLGARWRDGARMFETVLVVAVVDVALLLAAATSLAAG